MSGLTENDREAEEIKVFRPINVSEYSVSRLSWFGLKIVSDDSQMLTFGLFVTLFSIESVII